MRPLKTLVEKIVFEVLVCLTAILIYKLSCKCLSKGYDKTAQIDN